MRSEIKLAVYAAAGVGIYAILKRYGVLNDVGRWLSDQVPEDYKRQAAHAYKQAWQRASEAGEYVREQAERAGETVKQKAQDAVDSGTSAASQIVGKLEETAAPDGSTATHRVGRGVLH